MKTVNYGCLVWDNLPFQNAEDVAEFDRLAGKEGACLEEANANVTYRGGVLGKARDLLVEMIAAKTGIAQNFTVKKVKRKDGTESEVKEYEKDSDYVERVVAQLGVTEEAFAAQYQTEAAAITAAVAFDPKASTRTGAPKKLPDMYKDAAAKLVAAGRLEFWVNKLKEENAYVVIVSGDAEKDTLALGWGIRERELQKSRAAMAAYQ